jgi:hypothetical protein
MAELQFPNIVGSFLQGQQFGQQTADRRQQQQNKSRLSELASLAYGAGPDQRQQYVGEAVGIDADAGLALSKSLGSEDEAAEKRVLSAARFIAAAPAEQKAAAFQQWRPQIAQYLPGLPEAYDDQVGLGINAFIQSRSGQGDVKVVGNSLVDSAGNVVYQAPQRFSTDAGLIEVGPQGVRELRIGDTAPQAYATQESNGRPVTIAADVSPEDRAAIIANPDAFGAVPDGGSVTLPPQNVAPGGGRILPPGASARQEQLRLSQEANARAAEASARAREASDRAAREAADRAQFGTIPPGFRIKADRSGIEPVPGSPKPPGAAATESERTAATLLSRLEFSENQLRNAVAENPDAASPGVGASIAGAIPFVGEQARNLANSSERQRVEAAQMDILDAALTLGTGAAYTREQLEGYRKSYFPQIGDTQDTIDDKAARLQNVINAAKIKAGRAGPQGGSAGAPPRPQTEAEFNALPSGTVYIDPDDGRQYRKQ